MSPYRFAFHVLWIAHPVLEISVAYLLWRRKLHRIFPVFFAYILTQFASFCVLYPVYCWSSEHFFTRYWYYLDWTTTAVSTILGFKVLHEIFLDVLRPYHTLKDLGTVLFRWISLVMLLVGVVVAASAPADYSPMEQSIVVVQRCVRLAQVGLILFLLVFSSYLGVSWRNRSFGLSLGFGAFATVELVAVPLLLNGKGYFSGVVATLLNMLAWNATIAMWLTYVYRESVVRETSSRTLQSQRWDRSLTEIQHPVAPESLIPMFENMVERALSRSSSDGSAEPEAEPEPQSLIERMTAGK